MDKTRSTKPSIKKEDNGVVMRVSPKFAKVVEMQRKRVNEVTYDCVKGSDYEITDIIAKKILAHKLV